METKNKNIKQIYEKVNIIQCYVFLFLIASIFISHNLIIFFIGLFLLFIWMNYLDKKYNLTFYEYQQKRNNKKIFYCPYCGNEKLEDINNKNSNHYTLCKNCNEIVFKYFYITLKNKNG